MLTEPKKGRSLRLTSDMNQRLLDLCTHLGVTPNAYLVQEVGKAVARDELSFYLKGQADAMFSGLEKVIRDQVVQS